MTYLVFVSFNQSGSCSSALFSYNAPTQIATLLESNDGYTDVRTGNQIMLPGRVVVVPHTITLAEVRARMYPSGDVVYPTDTGESWCPGP